MLPLSSATWINATQGYVANQRGQLGAAPSDRDPKGGREKLTSFLGKPCLVFVGLWQVAVLIRGFYSNKR